jgi:hypothetical protein
LNGIEILAKDAAKIGIFDFGRVTQLLKAGKLRPKGRSGGGKLGDS